MKNSKWTIKISTFEAHNGRKSNKTSFNIATTSSPNSYIWEIVKNPDLDANITSSGCINYKDGLNTKL